MKQRIVPYLFILPFIIFIALFYITPAILIFIMSFFNLDSSFVWEFCGFRNYLKIFIDPNTLRILANTIIFVGATIVITIIIDLMIAILTTHYIVRERVGDFFKAIVMIPMITPAVVYSVLWLWFFGSSDKAMLNTIAIQLFGVEPINWISKYPMVIVILATVLTSMAFGTIVFSSAIKNIPKDQFKAARVDGANELEIVKSIILPNIKNQINFLILWETLGLFTNYVMILLITNGGPGIASTTWALSSYKKAFIDHQYGYGAAISLVLIVFVVVNMLFLLKLSNANKRKDQTNG